MVGRRSPSRGAANDNLPPGHGPAGKPAPPHSPHAFEPHHFHTHGRRVDPGVQRGSLAAPRARGDPPTAGPPDRGRGQRLHRRHRARRRGGRRRRGPGAQTGIRQRLPRRARLPQGERPARHPGLPRRRLLGPPGGAAHSHRAHRRRPGRSRDRLQNPGPAGTGRPAAAGSGPSAGRPWSRWPWRIPTSAGRPRCR